MNIRLILTSRKLAFLSSDCREKVNKRLVQAHIREFSAKCRNIIVKE